jgi:simple sugar transport system ATP-binding protein
MGAALQLQGTHKSFDGNPALVGASFSADWGEVHALLGENGAGKSTLMNVACGLYAPDTGMVRVDDRTVTIDGPTGAQVLGIGMVHQHFKLVRNMTVTENIMLGHGRGGWRQSQAYIRSKITEITERIGFSIDPDAQIDNLSVSEQQRVEIIKALVGGARILILDEPTAVLTDEESNNLLSQLHVLARQGRCVIIITHKLREVLAHADRVTVMRAGGTVAAGQSAQGKSAADLSRLMVGEAREYKRGKTSLPGEAVLSLQGISAVRDNGAIALDGLDLTLHGGQIYGLAGVGGNGQNEIAEILMGVRGLEKGEISLRGKSLSSAAPATLRRHGINCIPADRYIYGLAGDLSVMENFTISRVDSGEYGSALWVHQRVMSQHTEAAIDEFNILGARAATKARLLSGGNAQKLVLAREMAGDIKVLVAHSPTRGLDVRACAAVHEGLREVSRRGVAVLLLSEDLDEVLAVSDRIGVINRGRLMGEFDAPADRQVVGELMVGHA